MLVMACEIVRLQTIGHDDTWSRTVHVQPLLCNGPVNGLLSQKANIQQDVSHIVQPNAFDAVQSDTAQAHESQRHQSTKNSLRRARQRDRKKSERVLRQEAASCGDDVALVDRHVGSLTVGGGSVIQISAAADDAIDVVGQLQALATQEILAAWDTLHKELIVQVLIWQSQKSRTPSGKWVSVLDAPERQEQALCADLDRAVKTKSMNAVQSAVQRNAQNGGLLNNATFDACKQVLEADRLSELRWELAFDLRNIHQGDQSQTEATKLGERLHDCKVTKTGLHNQIQRLLGLPMLDLPSAKLTNAWSSERAVPEHAPAGKIAPQRANTSDSCALFPSGLTSYTVRIKNTFLEVDSDIDNSSATSTSSRRSLSTPITSFFT